MRPACASVKEGYLFKSGYFTGIGSFNVKTVADRHRHELVIFINIGDLK